MSEYGDWYIRYSPYWAEARVERNNGTLVEQMPPEEAHRRLNDFPTLQAEAERQKELLVDAKKIMLKFVAKVDSGRARSVETYAEMSAWLESLTSEEA